jgi:hypothetical protein
MAQSYIIEAIRTLAKRLYTENRMGGDEMRDWANYLSQVLLERIEPIEDEQLDKLVQGIEGSKGDLK